MERSWKVRQGESVALNDQEHTFAKDIRTRLASILERISTRREIASDEISEMGNLAHRLHMSLKDRGLEPKHHKYMIKNRGVPPTDVEFYRHVHSVEDLLRFIGNQNANDDPADITLDHEFAIPIYSRRWGHDDNLTLKRVRSGWVVTLVGEKLRVGRDGRIGSKGGTGLFQLFDHESINYPEDLPGYLEWLWEQAAERGLDHNAVDTALKQLAGWVKICEQNSPNGVFEGFK